MKDLKDVNLKELKVVVKELNDSGLIKKKIPLVGIKNKALLDAFTEALSELPEDLDIPQSIADFYNDLYADEIAEDVTDEEEGEEVEGEEEVTEDDEGDGTDVDEDGDPDEEVTEEEEVPEEEEVVVKEKKKKTPPVIRDKQSPKKKASDFQKRAEVNPKLSLTKKVANLLNFKDGRYKMTTYYPLDVEVIRVLEGNVGLYPTEILAAMKQNKNVAKKIEKFSELVLNREINKIKSAYAYIVGAIREDRVNGKLRTIMTTLLAGQEVPAEIGHYTTVKIARRALLAYMEVTGIDHSTMAKVKEEMVEKASKNPDPKPAPKTKPAAKPEPKPAAKPKTKPPKK